MKPIATVSAAALRFAAGVCDSKELRHQLKGVNIEPRASGGAYVIGSDGRACVVVIDKFAKVHNDAATVIEVPDGVRKALPRLDSSHYSNQAASTRCTMVESESKEVVFTIDSPSRVLSSRGRVIKSPTLVEWRRLVPREDMVLERSDCFVNADILKRLLKGLDAPFSPIKIMRTHDLGLHYLHLVKCPDVFVAFMPMNDKDYLEGVAAWRSSMAGEAMTTAWKPPEPQMMVQDPDHPQDELATAETAGA